MQKSESIAELTKALASAQSKFNPVPKNGKNPHLGNSYALLDDIIGTVKGPLNEHGLTFTQMITSENGRPALTTMLMHESDQWLASTAELELMQANRGTNDVQALGASITYMKRYALSAMLGVVSDEDIDGHVHTSGGNGNRRRKSRRGNGNGNGDSGHITLEEARGTELNFGKHEGEKLGDVVKTDRGYVKDYLIEEWQWDKGKKMARMLLEVTPSRKLMDRWVSISTKAEELGIEFDPLPDNPTKDMVIGRGKALKGLIAKAEGDNGKTEWPDAVIQELVDKDLTENKFSAEATLNKSVLDPSMPLNQITDWFDIYRQEREEYESDKAAEMANKWLKSIID